MSMSLQLEEGHWASGGQLHHHESVLGDEAWTETIHSRPEPIGLFFFFAFGWPWAGQLSDRPIAHSHIHTNTAHEFHFALFIFSGRGRTGQGLYGAVSGAAGAVRL